MTFPLPLVRLAAFSGLVLAPCIASFNAPAQSSEAQFTDALKIFQRARGGDSGQIEPAIAVRDDAGRISIALKGRKEKARGEPSVRPFVQADVTPRSRA